MAPGYMDRLCLRLRMSMIRPTDPDYITEVRRQLVQLAATDRIKAVQRMLEDEGLGTTRDLSAERPKPGPVAQ